MPVWHERTRAARESGALLLIGITEEQHPDRCELFAQWRGLDWPILWDPFNLTGTAAVPLAIAIDEHGVVRSAGLALDALDEFLGTAAAEPPSAPEPAGSVSESACGPPELAADARLEADQALARLLWLEKQHGAPPTARDFQACIAALERAADAPGAPPSAAFGLGVALRMRYDSPHALASDFQESLDRWRAALAGNPSQYIWRRRIQQWGPRLDKPYPFYDWIEEASRQLRERGEEPFAVRVPLTTSEMSGRLEVDPGRSERLHPDPDRKLPRDRDGWVSIETAVAPHTGGREGEQPRSVQIHLVLRPSTVLGVHWGNDAGATEIWIDHPDTLDLRRPDFSLPVPDDAESTAETRRADFTVTGPSDLAAITGTAFYFVCEGPAGQCKFLAQDFEIRLPGR